jgi:accessory gene regulator protein AgrB
MMWLWRDTHDPVRMAAHARGTFWFVIPSLPMFLVIPMLLERGFTFWVALAVGCSVTILLYLAATAVAAKMGMTL